MSKIGSQQQLFCLLIIVPFLIIGEVLPLISAAPLRDEGMEQSFKEDDLNGDGVLTQAEIEEDVKQAFDKLGAQFASFVPAAFKMMFPSATKEQKAVLDAVANREAKFDGLLDKAEAEQAYVKAILQLFDANNDAQISREEYAPFYKAIQPNADAPKNGIELSMDDEFNKIDTDGDEHASPTELRVFYRNLVPDSKLMWVSQFKDIFASATPQEQDRLDALAQQITNANEDYNLMEAKDIREALFAVTMAFDEDGDGQISRKEYRKLGVNIFGKD